MRRTTLVLAAAVAMCLAAKPVAAMELRLGGEGFGGLNTYRMHDFNDDVQSLNETGLTSFKLIRRGITTGLGLRLWATPNLMLSADWEPIFALTESNFVGEDSTGLEVDGYLKINLDAHAFQLGGGYFPPTERMLKYGFGAWVGYYRLHGEAKSIIADTVVTTENVKLKGSTIGVHAGGLLERRVGSRLALTASATYRFARINKVEDEDGSDAGLKVDYSGLMARIGLAWYPFESGK